MVQFFVFKSSVACHVNRHRKMIIAQVEDFLNNSKSIQEIQVLRKLDSITLQTDGNVSKSIVDPLVVSYKKNVEQETKPEDEEEKFVEDFDYEEVTSETELEAEEILEEIHSQVEAKQQKDEEEMVIVSNYLPCLKCGEVSTSDKTSEIHEFFKHSLLGIQVESEVENNQELFVVEDGTKFIGKCSTCSIEFDDSSSLSNHLILCHSFDMLLSINELFAVDTARIDFSIVNKYIEYIKDLIQSKDFDEKIEDDIKAYFYQFYSGDELKTVELSVDTVESDDENITFEDAEASQEATAIIPAPSIKTEKSVKRTVKNLKNLSEESRKWLRNEINLRRNVSKNEFGATRVFYRCAYCNVFSSNSAPGFRYHMASKHLRDTKLEDLKTVVPDFNISTNTKVIAKNTCVDCNLKFKDHKLFKAHRNYHDLFGTIAQYYLFPTCNTCSKLFIDESTLNLHLAMHDSNEDILQPLTVPPGALTLQGKPVDDPEIEQAEEISDDEFSWNCGHCARKFHREISCRLHLLLTHAGGFLCPIDKREFLGFKAVSLFSHHLKNKHSELFPEIKFACTFCKLEFSTIYDKLSHMKSCSSKKFACDHCGKKFFKKGDLAAHLKFVSGELYFQCKVCQKKCETVSDMKIHLRSHTKEVSLMKLLTKRAQINNKVFSETISLLDVQ